MLTTKKTKDIKKEIENILTVLKVTRSTFDLDESLKKALISNKDKNIKKINSSIKTMIAKHNQTVTSKNDKEQKTSLLESSNATLTKKKNT
jgi:hypothetical protein